ncbi:hypothetical protein PQO03_02855 [Lentisphaera profundi]|uniref:3-keto-disaccharide hydrolase domain-containing protein n=1 Tax=Lentisphaera profundi TaxID=1658616 RepID=A0ABY7VXV2_9BACT|nr:hypothetical protein [Lentisphaera profundi]WDE96898.1 hypothetical protein PQO03_02855 [Lentisphaera profundi]
MKYLFALVICLLIPLSAEELLVTPKADYMNESFDHESINNRIRPPKTMNWSVIKGEYIGSPKDVSSTKVQHLLSFWTPNPHNGLLLEFAFKFDVTPEFFEFHLGRNYAKVYFENGSLHFRRDENINGKIKSIDHEIAKQLNTFRWNKIRIESINNQYLIKINNSTPLFLKSIGENPEIYGGFKITGSGINKIYLDKVVLKSVKGPTNNLNEKISAYTRLDSTRSEAGKNTIVQSTSPQKQIKTEKEALKKQASPSPKTTKSRKLIYI